MTGEQKELFFELLTKKAVYGLDDAEQRQLNDLDDGSAAAEFLTLEMAAAATNVAGLPNIEPMPPDLRARILAHSHDHVRVSDTYTRDVSAAVATRTEERKGHRPWFAWLGWATAAAAFAGLAITLLVMPRETQRPPVASIQPGPMQTPERQSLADQRARLLATATDLTKATWSGGNFEASKAVTGEVVWSDEKQAGYATFRGLPVNDALTTCYQLWIFDQTQDKATPIDGGIFDVNSDGEVIIPINAKLETVRPEMFALTVERHGGVVVSKREKVAALAKVEPHTS